MDIYTDGGCRNNQQINNIGAWAYFIPELNVQDSGIWYKTTNNQMELKAAIEALKKAEQLNLKKVSLYIDSEYVVLGITSWIYKWIKNDWKKSSKKPVLNKKLWVEFFDLTKKFEINFIKVKGHSDNEYNNYVDKLANDKMDEIGEDKWKY